MNAYFSFPSNSPWRWVLFFIIAMAATTCSSEKQETSSVTGHGEATRPNIVLVVADDLGWYDLGAYGNPFYETPNLDKLAGRGIRFTQAYSAGHVCSPTRASILTGRYPARVGLTNYLYGTKNVEDSPVLPAPFTDRLPLEEVTIAEHLRAAGYKTGLVGKWHLGENTSLGESDPDLQGFEVTESWDYGLLPVGDSYEWYHTGDTTTPYRLPELTDEITTGALRFLDDYRDTSFFLMVTHYAVHLPLQGRADLIRKYRDKPNPRPDDFHPVYAAMLEQLDESVGAIVNRLERNGLLENTLFLFVSDNGGLAIGEAGDKPTTNGPLRNGKGTMFEGGIRVPLIAYWPGQWEGGAATDQLANTVDLLPTLLDAAGLPMQYDTTRPIDGRSWLTDEAAGDYYWHYPHFSNQGGRPRSAIRRGEHKLIESLEEDRAWLYNLNDDLGETEDLAASLPAVRDSLRAALWAWRGEVGARLPAPKTK